MKSKLVRLAQDNEELLLQLQRAIQSRDPRRLEVRSITKLANVAMWHGMSEAFRQFNVKKPKA